jgi:hypothetical protein
MGACFRRLKRIRAKSRSRQTVASYIAPIAAMSVLPSRWSVERLNASGKRPFSFRSHEIARINHLITNQLDLCALSFAFRFYEFRTWKNGSDERTLRTFGTGVWGRGFP